MLIVGFVAARWLAHPGSSCHAPWHWRQPCHVHKTPEQPVNFFKMADVKEEPINITVKCVAPCASAICTAVHVYPSSGRSPVPLVGPLPVWQGGGQCRRAVQNQAENSNVQGGPHPPNTAIGIACAHILAPTSHATGADMRVLALQLIKAYCDKKSIDPSTIR